MTSKRYSVEQLIYAISNSTSYRQALLKLGLAAKGGNYKTIHQLASKYNLDVSHFTGQGWSKGGSNYQKPKAIEDKLVKGKWTQSNRLKQQLFKTGLKQPVCESCGLTEWLNKPAPLELDHIDGDTYNNELTNLRILCPNCHALTPTYRGLNKSS